MKIEDILKAFVEDPCAGYDDGDDYHVSQCKFCHNEWEYHHIEKDTGRGDKAKKTIYEVCNWESYTHKDDCPVTLGRKALNIEDSIGICINSKTTLAVKLLYEGEGWGYCTTYIEGT